MALFLNKKQIKPISSYNLSSCNIDELTSLMQEAYASFTFLYKSKETIKILNSLYTLFISDFSNQKEGSVDEFSRLLSKILDIKQTQDTLTIQHDNLDEQFKTLQNNKTFQLILAKNNIKNVVMKKNRHFVYKEGSGVENKEFSSHIPQIAIDYYNLWLSINKRIDKLKKEAELKALQQELQHRQKLFIQDNLKENNLSAKTLFLLKDFIAENDYKYLQTNLSLSFKSNPDNLPSLPKTLNYSPFLYFYGKNKNLLQITDTYISTLILAKNSVKSIKGSDYVKIGLFDKQKKYKEKQAFVLSCLSCDFLYLKDLDKISIYNIDLLFYIILSRINKSLPIIISEQISKYYIFNLLKSIIYKRNIYTLQTLIKKHFYALEIHEKEYRPFSQPVKKRLGNLYFSHNSRMFRKLGQFAFSLIKEKTPLSKILSKTKTFVSALNKKNKKKIKTKEALNIVREICTNSCIKNSLAFYNKP